MANREPCGRPYDLNRPQSQYCVFHNPKNYIDRDQEFWKRFTPKLQQEMDDSAITEIDCTGYVFPEYNFSSIVFKKSICFRRSRFQGKASFKDCSFEGPSTDFSEAQFEAGADFSESFFGGERARFSRTRFAGSVNFAESNISSVEFDFRPIGLNSLVCFRQATFTSKEVNFATTSFQQGVDLSTCEFRSGNVRFDGCIFGRGTDFRQVTFEGQLVSFDEASFLDKRVSFDLSVFSADENIFSRTLFQGDTQISFDNCRFEGTETSFALAEFKGETLSFRNTMFRSKRTYFGRTWFKSNRVLFQQSVFESNETVFDQSVFEYGLDMVTDQGDGMFHGRVSFRGTLLQTPQAVTFQHINLSKAVVLVTDLRRVKFINMQWATIKRWRFWLPTRKGYLGIFDETLIDRTKAKEIAVVETAYRLLRQNYEDNRDYDTAGHFYFGEMEMLRLKDRLTLRNTPSWRVLYRIIAGYGQQWENSLALLVLTLLLSTAAMMFSGTEIPGRGAINYDLEFQFPHVGRLVSDFLQVLSFNILSFIRGSLVVQGLGTRFVQIMELLCIPVLITLFILSLRQRFRR